ncbi:hypothetical protein [Allorhodopirellula solitaria]|uniref:Uncharacterized protein n=1 Tax=Allorhodopirellula solitaria TaxID=2527987 RepID=A0A5C5X0Z6_9BACT|nr:hypothetical protein [Allorhodopirellula solitaria]TWT56538.1 hypothetical protein CA85_40710 [Allorhodopirellula solitaria]
MSPGIEIIVEHSGSLRMIYDERLDLGRFGRVSIQRGSHVEPTTDGRWTADLHPVGGPVLGPFSLRSEALNAEVAWLRRHWLASTEFKSTNNNGDHDDHTS